MSLIHSRFRALGGLVAASTLALAAPAWAAEAPAAPAADSMVVVRDAETGQLRAPTAEEAAALTAARAPATGRSAQKGTTALLETLSHASGAIGVRVSDEMASYSVVTKRADGKLEAACVESKSAAEQAVQSGVLPAQQAAEK